jgi:hypothetical protein
MVVSGLNQNRYLVNNPIWVDITNAGAKVQMQLSGLAIPNDPYPTFTFYTHNGSVSIDIAEIIKSLFTVPTHPPGLVNGQVVPGLTFSQTITFSSGGDSASFSKTFLRGGKLTMGTNQTVPANSLLSESPKIPVWDGYNSAKYTLNQFNQVVFNNILTNSEIDRRKVVTCNPVFTRFLNTKGGYSFWLFEEWEITETTKDQERIDRRGNPIDMGQSATWKLNVRSRVPQEYTATMSALLKSLDIYVWGMEGLLNSISTGFSTPSYTWMKVYNAGGSMKWNSFEQVNEVSMDFDILFKYKGELL